MDYDATAELKNDWLTPGELEERSRERIQRINVQEAITSETSSPLTTTIISDSGHIVKDTASTQTLPFETTDDNSVPSLSAPVKNETPPV